MTVLGPVVIPEEWPDWVIAVAKLVRRKADTSGLGAFKRSQAAAPFFSRVGESGQNTKLARKPVVFLMAAWIVSGYGGMQTSKGGERAGWIKRQTDSRSLAVAI